MQSGNVIVSFGQNFIEFFEFSQINNNNNLAKKHEISINNNNNNNNNINNDTNINIINNNQENKDEILCIELYNQIIICGHKSGILSFWKPTNGVYLQNNGTKNISDKAINKILLTKLSDNKDYLVICCSDKTIKIFSFENDDINLIKSFDYDDEVMDIKIANDYDNQILFIISFKNGLLKVLNNNFVFLFDIPSRFKETKPRKVIAMRNQLSPQNNSKGDYILITEGKFIDMYTLIKPANHKQEIHGKNNNMNNNQNMHPHQYFNPHGPHSFNPHFQRGGKY